MRRIIALIVLFIDAYVGVRHAEFGMLGPVVVLVAVLVAILAGAVVLFNLSFTRPGPPQDSGFGMSSPVGIGIGFIGIFVFAAAPLFIAARGLYQGRLPAFGSGPDVLFYQRPVAFLLNLSIWVAIGLAVLWLLRTTASARKNEDEQGDE
jgi:hypothetical protein